MKIIDFVIILFFIIGCNESTPKSSIKLTERKEQQPQKENRDSIPLDYHSFGIIRSENLEISYPTIKAKISQEKQNQHFKNLPLDSISYYFTESLLNNIIPYWYGTTWSFTGHTSQPKVGEIACGYFVSTTLKDMGLNINRYKLAQQNPHNEALTISINDEVLEIANDSPSENIKALEAILDEGISFIGFDQSHVGYILKRKNQLFLIHSNYIGAEGVIIEPIEKSKVFSSFQRFYIAKISSNKTLLKRWISNKKIKVVIK